MTKGEKLMYKDSEKGERNSSDIKTWGELDIGGVI